MTSKIQSYIGFAIKSRNIVFGYDNLVKFKSKYMLVLYDDTLSVKVQDRLIMLAQSHHWDIIKLPYTIESVINRNCKALGIIDVNLSNAIKQNI